MTRLLTAVGLIVLALAAAGCAGSTPPEAGASDLPNTRCRPVRVGRLAGSRCLDTISMSVSTVLQDRDRWYVLTTSARRPATPRGAYDRVVASFRPS